MKVGYYVWMTIQNGKVKNKLGKHTEGPFLILNRLTCTFLIQRDDLFKRVNSDRIEWNPVLTKTEALPENDGNLDLTL